MDKCGIEEGVRQGEGMRDGPGVGTRLIIPLQTLVRIAEDAEGQGGPGVTEDPEIYAIQGHEGVLIVPHCSMSPEFLKLLKKGHENASPGTRANPLLASICA